MLKEIYLRENHKELLEKEEKKKYKIYTDNYNEIIKDLNFLHNLLHEGGVIRLKPIKDSWFGYYIEIYRKGDTFKVGKNYKGKFTYRMPEIYKYSNPLRVFEIEKFEKPRPKNYTFNKLTAKKVFECFDYMIAKLEFCKKTLLEKTEKANKKFGKDLMILEEIAKALKTEIKQINREAPNRVEYWINTPIGIISIKKDNTIHEVNTDYNLYKIQKIIELVKKE